MASWTAPTTFATGDLLDVASANTWSNDCTFLYEAPYALAWSTNTQSIANGTNTQILFGGDTLGYGFSITSNNLVLPLAGIYSVAFSAAMASNSNAGVVSGSVQHNGTQISTGSLTPSNGTYSFNSVGSAIVSASASDTLSLYIFHNLGGAANSGTGSDLTYLHCNFLGSQ